jgi:cytochrome c553
MKTMMLKLLSLAGVAFAVSSAYAGADMANGEAIVKKLACVACHGEGLNKPIDPTYPKIAGQYEDYLYVALKAYKTENNALVGRNNPSMVGFAKQLSLQDMRDVAAYVSQLPGDLKAVSQPKFRIGEK